MRNFYKKMVVLVILFCAKFAFAQPITENFDDITTLAGSGWVIQNNSAPVGSISWFQGNPTTAGGPFNSYNGAANSYIGVNYNSTAGLGTISNWLITPNRTFRNGDLITFYTRKHDLGQDYPDRIEVRLSTNGASTSVGTDATALGDFTTLLLSVNPSLSVGGYPRQWTQYTITISGLTAPTSGRLVFRYFVTNAGPAGANSDYIGIDQFTYTPYVCPAFTMTPGGALTNGVTGSAYSTTLAQTGALGTPSFAVMAGALPPGVSLSSTGTISGTPTATGTFNFTVKVSDASGCSGVQSYTITVVCSPNPIKITDFPTLCKNSGLYTLTEASPAGGVYSGTGVSGGKFDPTVGSQTITYDYTDPYGCSFSFSKDITVNTGPTVTLATFASICSSGGLLTLTGGLPAGGTYSGTGVSGGQFDPSVGTQTITYAYTDANGCSASASQVLAVTSVDKPTGNAVQTFNAGDNLNVLIVNGQNIKWYATQSNAASHINPLPNTTQIINNTTYYATQTENGCESISSLAVNAYNETLGVSDLSKKLQISIYPNPVNDIINFISPEKINKILITSMDGKRISEKNMNGERKLDVHNLTQGTYLITIFTEKGIETIKFIKQ